MFGEFLKDKRLEKGLSLREFCRLMGEDASNWSKIERGILKPPQDEEKLKKIAEVLCINENTEDWKNLNEFASIDAGKIPNYLMSDKEVLNSLPIFFRTIGSEKPTQEEIEKLIEIIRKRGQ